MTRKIATTLLLLPLVCAQTPIKTKLATANRHAGSETEAFQLSAPITGYSVDESSRQARLILGVPGATHFSNPVDFPDGALSVRATPGHRWLLVVGGAGETGAVSAWIPETGARLAFPGVKQAPDSVWFSRSANSVAFQWTETGRVAVYTGLPEAVNIAADMSVEPGMALAVNDSGRLLAGVSPNGELRLMLRDGEPVDQLIREAHAISSFGFYADDNTLAIADVGRDQIELVGGIAEGTYSRRSLQLPRPIPAIAQMAAGGNGWFFFVEPEMAAMYRLEVAGVVRAVALEPGAAFTALERLRLRGTALLAAPEGGLPRIVSSHEAGDDLHFLPTAAPAGKANVHEEVIP